MTTGDALFLALFHTPLGGIALLFIAAVVTAILIPKKTAKKVAAVVAVLLMAALPIAYVGWEQETKNAKAKARFDEANAIFKERCKSAGERILRTVENVEGVALLKMRPETRNTRSQFDLTDPYGRDLLGDDYIGTFLRTFNSAGPRNEPGYEFVEVPDSRSGVTFRYTGEVIPQEGGRPKFSLVKKQREAGSARYGVTYDDISTHDDRVHWIAGSSLRVVDLATNEVIAERIGFMMDPDQGTTVSGSEPWERAARHACPAFTGSQPLHEQMGQAARFVTKVALPSGRK